MSNKQEYREGYRDGFKDGVADAVKTELRAVLQTELSVILKSVLQSELTQFLEQGQGQANLDEQGSGDAFEQGQGQANLEQGSGDAFGETEDDEFRLEGGAIEDAVLVENGQQSIGINPFATDFDEPEPRDSFEQLLEPRDSSE